MPLGGNYTVTLTFEGIPRVAVEHIIDDLRNSGDYPATADLEVVEEYDDEKFTH